MTNIIEEYKPVIDAAWQEAQKAFQKWWKRFDDAERETLRKAQEIAVRVAIQAVRGIDVTEQRDGLIALCAEFSWMGKNRAYNILRDSALNALWNVGKVGFAVL